MRGQRNTLVHEHIVLAVDTKGVKVAPTPKPP